MQIAVLANDLLFNELKSGVPEGKIDFIRVHSAYEFTRHPDVDGYFDLIFENTGERAGLLSELLPKPIFINSVVHTLAQTNNSFIRINAWPGFLKRSLIEASCLEEAIKPEAEKIAASLNKKIDWVPDIPGFVSARVISMIINEAYFALQEGVSTKEEIDTAMKLGTNYPFGPFEWCKHIGLKNIYELLSALNKINLRYQPGELLKQEALQ